MIDKTLNILLVKETGTGFTDEFEFSFYRLVLPDCLIWK